MFFASVFAHVVGENDHPSAVKKVTPVAQTLFET